MIRISNQGSELIRGETPSGTASEGDRSYSLLVDDNYRITLRLAYTIWSNGEHDIQCVQADNDPILKTIIGRMRLVIINVGNGQGIITIRKAILKTTLPPHANLINASMSDITSYLTYLDENGGNSLAKKIERTKIGTKEEIIKDQGKHKNQLVCNFPIDDQEIPLCWFFLTRAYAILDSKNK